MAGISSYRREETVWVPKTRLGKLVAEGKIRTIEEAFDSGLKVPCGEEVFPSEDRIRGAHVAGNAKSSFADYEKRGLKPADLPAHFDEVKKKITGAYGGAQ